MRPQEEGGRSATSWGAGSVPATGKQGGCRAPHHFTPMRLIEFKRRRECDVAKLVVAEPLGEIVVAMPYRSRPMPTCVSLRPIWIEHAARQGATWWIVRDDTRGRCYGLPLREVNNSGWVKPSEGVPERFIPISSFRTIPWQGWRWVDQAIMLDDLLEKPEETVDTGGLAARMSALLEVKARTSALTLASRRRR